MRCRGAKPGIREQGPGETRLPLQPNCQAVLYQAQLKMQFLSRLDLQRAVQFAFRRRIIILLKKCAPSAVCARRLRGRIPAPGRSSFFAAFRFVHVITKSNPARSAHRPISVSISESIRIPQWPAGLAFVFGAPAPGRNVSSRRWGRVPRLFGNSRLPDPRIWCEKLQARWR